MEDFYGVCLNLQASNYYYFFDTWDEINKK
jgi:hypothetical protein